MQASQAEDQPVIAELERVRESARICFEHYSRQASLGVWLGPPSPDLHELTEHLVELLEKHPLLGRGDRFFGEKQLMLFPRTQVANLLRIAVEEGSAAAIGWLHKVATTEVADLRLVAEVYGLKLSERHDLKNGVSLMPLEALLLSGNAAALIRQSKPALNSLPAPFAMQSFIYGPPIGATIEVKSVCGHRDHEEASRDRLAQNISEQLIRTIRAFTLVNDAAPVIGISWVEFVDPDLAKAELGRMWRDGHFEGPLRLPTPVDSQALDWVYRYLALSPNLRGRCDIALDRLNLARRRQSPGDKAIEGSICLEALLGGDGQTDLTYKLRLRAALLLESELAERKTVSQTVRDFYRLRGNTVHGVPPKQEELQKDASCADRGLKICARVLQTIVRMNEEPVLTDWELSGGRPA